MLNPFSWSLFFSFHTEWTELPGLWLSGKSLLWSLGLYVLHMTSWSAHPQSLIYSSCAAGLFPSTVWWWKILDLYFTVEQWNSLWCLFVVLWVCGRVCGWWVELEESKSCTQLCYLLKSKIWVGDVSTLHYHTFIPLLFLLTSFFFIGIFSSGSHSVIYICNFIFIMLSAHLTAHFSWLCLFSCRRLYKCKRWSTAHCCQCFSPTLHYSVSSPFSIVSDLIRLTSDPQQV